MWFHCVDVLLNLLHLLWVLVVVRTVRVFSISYLFGVVIAGDHTCGVGVVHES